MLSGLSLLGSFLGRQRDLSPQGFRIIQQYLATSVVTLGEDVLIGDAMHSVTLLRKDQKELKTVSRCHTALWPVSMEFNGKHDLIIANVSISSLLILECMSDASISVTEIYTR